MPRRLVWVAAFVIVWAVALVGNTMLCRPPCQVVAGEEVRPREGAARDDPRPPRPDAREERGEREEAERRHEPEPMFLGRTLRLQFKLIPEEADDQPHWVLVAAPEFHYEIHFGNEAETFHFEIGGQILPIRDREDEFLVRFNTVMRFKGDDGRGSVNAAGSSSIKVGTTRNVASLGDKTVTLRLTAAEEPAPKAKPKAGGKKDELF